LSGGTTMLIAARRYLLDGATRSEIATELGISRFRVARLLDLARSRGLMRLARAA
jgi:DNA-binding transcriptional regulator LsrR (DeoR family)